MYTKKIVFGKIDLDTIVTIFLSGARANYEKPEMLQISGSANRSQLKCKTTTCVEVGGSGQTLYNNFDHHIQELENTTATYQYFLRYKRLVEYIQTIDVGTKIKGPKHKRKASFPTLVWLISGLLLTESDPQKQLNYGLRVIEAIIQMDIDPFSSMKPLSEVIPEVNNWIKTKKSHEKEILADCKNANWLKTKRSRALAVIESSKIGIIGSLHSQGADVVVVYNKRFTIGCVTYERITISSRENPLCDILKTMDELETGWGGLCHSGIVSSPRGVDCQLTLEVVVGVLLKNF